MEYNYEIAEWPESQFVLNFIVGLLSVRFIWWTVRNLTMLPNFSIKKLKYCFHFWYYSWIHKCNYGYFSPSASSPSTHPVKNKYKDKIINRSEGLAFYHPPGPGVEAGLPGRPYPPACHWSRRGCLVAADNAPTGCVMLILWYCYSGHYHIRILCVATECADSRCIRKWLTVIGRRIFLFSWIEIKVSQMVSLF